MKHFIYKTTHKNGKYYVGRHSESESPNRFYWGSGVWIKGIRNKRQVLTREILAYATTIEELKEMETRYLADHYDKPDCMNMITDSSGFTSESAKALTERLRAEDRLPAHTAMKRGTHINLTDNPSIRYAERGEHWWANGKSPNADGRLNAKLISEGRHNWLGPAENQRRIDAGTHNFLGSSANEAMLASGTHPSQIKKTCEHCSKVASVGMYKRWHGDNCKHKA